MSDTRGRCSRAWALVAFLSLFAIPSLAQAQGQSGVSNLTAGVTGCHVTLSWDAPTEDAAAVTGYQVLRAQGDGHATVLEGDTMSTSTTYADSTVEDGETYTYQVRARRGGMAGEESDTVEVAIPEAPVPMDVAVTTVPIVATSTVADYFVLYVRHDEDGAVVETPVAVAVGEDGTTTLAENIAPLPAERYRVEKYLVDDPADVDGDCIDDITELQDPMGSSPTNPARFVPITDGTVVIRDEDVLRTIGTASHVLPSGRVLLHLKFVVVDMDTDRPGIYFMNTNTHLHHGHFLRKLGLSDDVVRGTLLVDLDPPDDVSEEDTYYYYYYYNLTHPLSTSATPRLHTLLAASMPVVEDNLAVWAPNVRIKSFQAALPVLRESRVRLVFDTDVYQDVSFQTLNPGVGYGVLRSMEADERPHPRDLVIFGALPNDLPRVAGIISTVPQTPLSHINLRAVQQDIPNAFIRDALDSAPIAGLLGKYVRYEVTDNTWTVSPATVSEVEAHHASSRPPGSQTPQRDLRVTGITPLSEIGFDHWDAFGVKAANLAVLRTLGFREGTVPDGFAIPFYFYDTFMTETILGQETVLGKRSRPDEEKITLSADTRLFEAVMAMLAHPRFQTDFEIQDEMLDDLRDAIKDAASPQWIIDALTAMHETFPEGQSLRYRSSTNNEDLPGFNSAGLYNSYTQNPDETEEEGIDKSLKQVFASLWTFRAFAEREFYRVDHLSTAMGVLVHPNFKDELVNGVAVSFDPTSGSSDLYYVNSQLGEDLVTNPEAHSVPEEMLLYAGAGGAQILATSNLVEQGTLLMTRAHRDRLGDYLEVIHDHFEGLYNPAPDEPFAMEIEFKITSDDVLAIKQARPWVFSGSSFGGGFQPPIITLPDVIGVNDAPDFRESMPARSVSESAGEGDNVGAPVTATDIDGDRLSYSLSGPDASSFEIDQQSGQITVATGVTFTARETYIVTVEADDGSNEANATASVDVTITVTTGPVGPPIIIGGGAGGGGPSGPSPSEVDFEWTVKHDIEALDSGHDRPTGMWSDGATLWLLQNGDGADDAVYAHDLKTGERVEEREFALDERNRAPRGVCSDRTVVWISDSGRNLLFAHDLESGERLPERDIPLDVRNLAARGIWCERETVWVLDGGRDSLFAYDLGSGDLLGEFALDDANGDPHGIWSDGVTFWVSDHGAKKLFAYRLPVVGVEDEASGERLELARIRDEEFTNLSRASNNSPQHLVRRRRHVRGR